MRVLDFTDLSLLSLCFFIKASLPSGGGSSGGGGGWGGDS